MKDNTPQLYPLKFHPILKEKIWGGSKLKELLNKSAEGNIGESWELSGVDGDKSIVKNGAFEGKNIDFLLSEYKGKLVGERVYKQFGNTFPLLFKFIDAADDLSVQVHPEDSLAKLRHNSFGKSEMWYILQADVNSRLIIGFKDDVNEKDYLKALSEKRIIEILNSIAVEKGDVFIINPGTVHAIGTGVLLAEIQQTSDVTYRIYDWDRPGTDGKMRQLHTELALDAIDFPTKSKRIIQDHKTNSPVPIGGTQFFSINKLNLSGPLLREFANIDSFVVYMCLEGEAIVEGNGFSEVIKKGETVLIPACFDAINFKTERASFLEVYIP